jgi:monolysocardiolipin acyltransferase
MDSAAMPEIIPIWLSGGFLGSVDLIPGFDTIMPEPRSWPKPLPRFGGNVSITIGNSLTPRIQPLVDRWRKDAGDTEKVRISLVDQLRDGLQELGERVETEEGRFEKGLWSQSRPR